MRLDADMRPAPPDVSSVERLALRPKEAAEALGVSERKLRELTPELPHIRRGGVLLFPVAALRRWLEEKARTGGEVDAAVDEILKSVGRG